MSQQDYSSIAQAPPAQPLEYATPRAAQRPRLSFDRRVAITLIICGTVMMIAPWMLAITAVARGGNVNGDFWAVPFVWFSFLAGGFIVLVAMIKAPRSGER